jgi:putative flavoprotein involved in K+ transport
MTPASPTLPILIVGGGQAGLALSYCLAQRGLEHQVLEQAERLGHAWRTQRWDSFTLVTPNWTWRLPGDEYAGPDPDGFLPRDEIVARLEQYAARHTLPVQLGLSVTAVRPLAEGGFTVETSAGPRAARAVVIATGLFQRPRLPAAAGLSPAVTQLPATAYRQPGALPPGAVLVVGSAQSGCQITEDLLLAGREVYLSTGSAGRIPRRFRGRDTFAWAAEVGIFDKSRDKLEDPRERFEANPHVSGARGGRSLNLHQFARDGVHLLGRFAGAEGARLHFAPDLHTNLAAADKFEAELIKGLNGYIAEAGLDAPPNTLPDLRDGYAVEPTLELALDARGITTVIWAAGFTWDFSLVHAPVFDDFGYPIQTDGATAVPGLYFLGLPWLRTQSSGLLYGVGQDAALVAERLAAQLGA